MQQKSCTCFYADRWIFCFILLTLLRQTVLYSFMEEHTPGIEVKLYFVHETITFIYIKK